MTKIVLKFPQKRVTEPITAQVILESKVPINILSANVTPIGGEILAEVNSRDADRVAELLRKRGVTVEVQKKINVDTHQCIDCGACYSICPVDAIAFQKDYAIIFDVDKCVACGLYIDACPTRAIRL